MAVEVRYDFGPPSPSGEKMCFTREDWWRWSDGRVEVFVVGSDGVVYHSYQYQSGGGWSAWLSLGGQDVRLGVWDGPIAYPEIPDSPQIMVVGGDHIAYCKGFYNGAWQASWTYC